MNPVVLLLLCSPVLAQGPLLTELMASNTKTLEDEDGETPDWIELHNPTAAPLDLSGWFLTDDDDQLDRWQLPVGLVLAPGELRIIFASGKDRSDLAGQLHTDFKLGKDGEYLALVQPDGLTVEHEYAPEFPAQYANVSYGLSFDPGPGTAETYFLAPTPGMPNGPGGPLLVEPEHTPSFPNEDQDVLVTVLAPQGLAAGTSLTVSYRVEFDTEQVLPMSDDGQGPDQTAGDGVYSQVLPRTAFAAGELLRWRLDAVDGSKATRLPPNASPNNSAEYFGTGVLDPSVQTALEVFTYWTDDIAGSNSVGGARASVVYEGHYYDNVEVRRRGGSSASYLKKSYKFDFNPDQRLLRGDGPPADELDLNTTYADKAFVRQPLSYELYQLAGNASPDCFPVRVQRNGEFFSVAMFLEEPGEEAFLERHGLDPEGALYKMYNTLNHHKNGVEKKTRLQETHADLKKLVDGLATSDPAQLEVFLFDEVDVDACLSYLAATWIIHDNDHIAKNYLLYRDSEGTRTWQFVPWDKDLTWGRNYTLSGGVLNDTLWARNDPYSHPLFGDQAHPKNDGPWNRLIDRLYRVPRIQEMYLARLRSLCDLYLGQSGPAWPEYRMAEYVVTMSADVARDEAKWGIPSWGYPYDFRADLERLVVKYLRKRRYHLYVDHGAPGTGLIPPPNLHPPVSLAVLEGDPASGKHGHEYVSLVNPGSAADLSGWRVQGGLTYVFPEGTMIGRADELFLSPNPFKFRGRTTSPTGGEGRHVIGPYEGNLEAGEWVRLFDRDGVLVDEQQY
jgi:hypothetical protein